jgi:outer membrane protein assembly factor BamB
VKILAVGELATLLIVAGLAWGMAEAFNAIEPAPASSANPAAAGASSAAEAGPPPAASASETAAEPAQDADPLRPRGTWTQHRGDRRDGCSDETRLLRMWLPSGPRELWRAAGGRGYSEPVIADGRLITLYGRDGAEWVAAFDIADGRRLWETRSDDDFEHEFGAGPQGSPVIDGVRVYALGAGGMLTCLRAATGEVIWRDHVLRRWGAAGEAALMRYGFSHTPLIEGGLVLVNAGVPAAPDSPSGSASVVAYDKLTGRVVWASGDSPAGYASPIGVTVSGRRVAVFFTAAGLEGFDPADGRRLFLVPYKTNDDCNLSTPIWWPEERLLFVSSAHDKGAMAVRLSAAPDGGVSADTLWRNLEMRNRISTCVRRGRYVYGFDGQSLGVLKCLDLLTGSTVWADRSVGMGSLTYADGCLYVLSDKGRLALVSATPDGYREHCRRWMISGRCWTPPVITGGRLYLRDEKEIRCLDIRVGDGTAH